MKTLKWALLALIFFTIAFNSCKKSSGDEPTTVSNELFFKFKGNEYRTTKLSIDAGGGSFRITGTISSSTIMALQFNKPLKVGSYDILAMDAQTVFVSSGYRDYTGFLGTVTITSLTSTTMAGTFAFRGVNIIDQDTQTFTTGRFQTNYHYTSD